MCGSTKGQTHPHAECQHVLFLGDSALDVRLQNKNNIPHFLGTLNSFLSS